MGTAEPLPYTVDVESPDIELVDERLSVELAAIHAETIPLGFPANLDCAGRRLQARTATPT